MEDKAKDKSGLEWLYKPVGIDKEEYLLGRRVNKHTDLVSLAAASQVGPS